MLVPGFQRLAAAVLLLGMVSCTSSSGYINSDVEPVAREQIRALQLLLDGGVSAIAISARLFLFSEWDTRRLT